MFWKKSPKKYINLRKELRNSQKEHFLLKHYFNKKWNLRKVKKGKAPDISTITENIAFVIDGNVVEIIHCQDKLASILLSSPEIVRVPPGQVISLNWKYEDGKFMDPRLQSSHNHGDDHDHHEDHKH